jgi:hypothetical protein
MKRTWIALIALAGLLAMPVIARAHDGKDKTVMGIVSSISGSNLMVKTADGKSIMVMMDAKTKVTQGKTKVDAKVLKIGDRVVASGPEDKDMISAETVQIGAAAATTAKK